MGWKDDWWLKCTSRGPRLMASAGIRHTGNTDIHEGKRTLHIEFNLKICLKATKFMIIIKKQMTT